MHLFNALLKMFFSEELLDYREVEMNLAKLPGIADRSGNYFSYSLGRSGSTGLRKLTMDIFPEQITFAAAGDLDGYGEFVRLLVLTLPGMDWSNAFAVGDMNVVPVVIAKIENWWWYNVRQFKLTPGLLKSRANLYAQRGSSSIQEDYSRLLYADSDDSNATVQGAFSESDKGHVSDRDLPGDEVPNDWDPSLQG